MSYSVFDHERFVSLAALHACGPASLTADIAARSGGWSSQVQAHLVHAVKLEWVDRVRTKGKPNKWTLNESGVKALIDYEASYGRPIGPTTDRDGNLVRHPFKPTDATVTKPSLKAPIEKTVWIRDYYFLGAWETDGVSSSLEKAQDATERKFKRELQWELDESTGKGNPRWIGYLTETVDGRPTQRTFATLTRHTLDADA